MTLHPKALSTNSPSAFDPITIAAVGTALGSIGSAVLPSVLGGKSKKQMAEAEIALAQAQLNAQVERTRQNASLVKFVAVAAVATILLVLIFKS